MTATPIEVRKIGYRQSKDGFVLSLVIHPNEQHDALAIAPIGARFMAALVEINDDETPVEPIPTYQEMRGILKPEKPKEKREYSLPQRVAMVCNEPAFGRFLSEELTIAGFGYEDFITNPMLAADLVRSHCGVASRSQILPGTEAAKHWDKLHAQYLGWQRGM